MPLYDYHCMECGPFHASRSLAEFAGDARCPACDRASPRMLAAPGLLTMPANRRTAFARNEKNAWSPEVVRRDGGHGEPRHTHGPGCGHGHSHRTHAHGGKPWMVGHSH